MGLISSIYSIFYLIMLSNFLRCFSLRSQRYRTVSSDLSDSDSDCLPTAFVSPFLPFGPFLAFSSSLQQESLLSEFEDKDSLQSVPNFEFVNSNSSLPSSIISSHNCCLSLTSFRIVVRILFSLLWDRCHYSNADSCGPFRGRGLSFFLTQGLRLRKDLQIYILWSRRSCYLVLLLRRVYFSIFTYDPPPADFYTLLSGSASSSSYFCSLFELPDSLLLEELIEDDLLLELFLWLLGGVAYLGWKSISFLFDTYTFCLLSETFYAFQVYLACIWPQVPSLGSFQLSLPFLVRLFVSLSTLFSALPSSMQTYPKYRTQYSSGTSSASSAIPQIL